MYPLAVARMKVFLLLTLVIAYVVALGAGKNDGLLQLPLRR